MPAHLYDTLDRPFVALAIASCPPFDEMLVALEREFRAVHRETVADRLDDAARELFPLVGASPQDQVVGLARAAWALLPEEDADAPSWLLSCALDDGRATGVVRAATAVELGRRAGITARPARLRGCWAIHLPGVRAQVAADCGGDVPEPPEYVPAGAMCAHQVAFTALSGLAQAWREAGDAARAQRASGLRLLLPLDDGLREVIQAEVRALS